MPKPSRAEVAAGPRALLKLTICPSCSMRLPCLTGRKTGTRVIEEHYKIGSKPTLFGCLKVGKDRRKPRPRTITAAGTTCKSRPMHYTFGQNELAKKVLSEFPTRRIANQIEPDGRQLRELQRSQAWNYSLFNLEALFNAASIADKLGMDLWNYAAPDK